MNQSATKELSAADKLREQFDIEIKIPPKEAKELISKNGLTPNTTITGDLDLRYQTVNPYEDAEVIYFSNSGGITLRITREDGSVEIQSGLKRLPSKIIELPKNLTIEGSLFIGASDYLRGTLLTEDVSPNVESLPDNLKIGKVLDLNHTKIKSLPNDLSVGHIFIEEAKFDLIAGKDSKYITVDPAHPDLVDEKSDPNLLLFKFFPCDCKLCEEKTKNKVEEFKLWCEMYKPPALHKWFSSVTTIMSNSTTTVHGRGEWLCYARRKS